MDLIERNHFGDSEGAKVGAVRASWGSEENGTKVWSSGTFQWTPEAEPGTVLPPAGAPGEHTAEAEVRAPDHVLRNARSANTPRPSRSICRSGSGWGGTGRLPGR